MAGTPSLCRIRTLALLEQYKSLTDFLALPNSFVNSSTTSMNEARTNADSVLEAPCAGPIFSSVDRDLAGCRSKPNVVPSQGGWIWLPPGFPQGLVPVWTLWSSGGSSGGSSGSYQDQDFYMSSGMSSEPCTTVSQGGHDELLRENTSLEQSVLEIAINNIRDTCRTLCSASSNNPRVNCMNLQMTSDHILQTDCCLKCSCARDIRDFAPSHIVPDSVSQNLKTRIGFSLGHFSGQEGASRAGVYHYQDDHENGGHTNPRPGPGEGIEKNPDPVDTSFENTLGRGRDWDGNLQFADFSNSVHATLDDTLAEEDPTNPSNDPLDESMVRELAFRLDTSRDLVGNEDQQISEFEDLIFSNFRVKHVCDEQVVDSSPMDVSTENELQLETLDTPVDSIKQTGLNMSDVSQPMSFDVDDQLLQLPPAEQEFREELLPKAVAGSRKYRCTQCNETFALKRSFRCHVRSHETMICDQSGCGTRVKDLRTLQRHLKAVHGSKDFRCVCGLYATARADNLLRHRKKWNCTPGTKTRRKKE